MSFDAFLFGFGAFQEDWLRNQGKKSDGDRRSFQQRFGRSHQNAQRNTDTEYTVEKRIQIMGLEKRGAEIYMFPDNSFLIVPADIPHKDPPVNVKVIESIPYF